ncbi:ATP-binding protein [Cysteiniphilum halobium]|uniref:ATP-binding protein n=1 Tax=Cysteiniphilum halobium TaxID=2219059 RepID=UPI003F8510C4
MSNEYIKPHGNPKGHKVDALLNLANKSVKSRRGRLKIFLGAAPGVGKTYAMLTRAQELKHTGHDVAIGLVVTHGRKETEDLVSGLEQIPLKAISYKGKVFNELDVDAIIQRKPETVIIDELPHKNLATERNKKRYLDIIEILEVGINVYTAINIQHIASLSHEVEEITQVTIEETVPDSFIQSADELMIVDITPEELIKRLNEGRVYHHEMAKRALSRYFQYTNLAILRDYALRLAASHVGEDVRSYKKLYDPYANIAASPCVLVCCAYDASTPRLLRKGKQLATIANARLLAIFIHNPQKQLSRVKLREIRRYKTLALELGYQLEHISGGSLSKAIIRYANDHNVTDIVIGKSRRAKWLDWLLGSVVYDVIRHSEHKQVHVVSTHKARVSDLFLRFKEAKQRGTATWLNIIKALAITFVAGLFIFFGMNFVGLSGQSLILVLVLILCAYRYGLKASIASSILSFVMYMYMYLTPNFKFTIGTFSQVITFIIFMLVVLVVSQLTARMRHSLKALRSREKTLSMLYKFSNEITIKQKDQSFYQRFLAALAQYFDYEFAFIVADDYKVYEIIPNSCQFSDKEHAAVHWCWSNKTACGKSTQTFSALPWYFEPLIVDERMLGIIAICVKFEYKVEAFLFDQILIKTMLSHVANALLQQRLLQQEQEAMILKEQEKLQKTLLSSVSHDLKTPLASITGALSSVLSYEKMFSKEDKAEMLDLALEESRRLDQYIDHILQMLKFSAGVTINKQSVHLNTLINQGFAIAEKRFASHQFELKCMNKALFINGDSMLIDQVLTNLIANAVKFSAENSKITIRLKLVSAWAVIEVSDQGIGLKPAELESVFSIFHRLKKSDSYTKGHGLGLAICKDIISAHHGEIYAISEGTNKGSTFVVKLPIVNPHE